MKEGTLQNQFYVVTVTLIPKSHQDSTKRELQIIFPHEQKHHPLCPRRLHPRNGCVRHRNL